MAEEVVKEYKSSLEDLTFNSKPIINMLTMLADDNVQYAAEIVQVIEAHLQKVQANRKLPALYLVDSIIKNVSNSCYPQLFSNNLASMFVGVFAKVDEKTRANMYKLRQTWTSIFPNRKLYALDTGVHRIDPAWPVTATPPEAATNVHNIHVNPKFIMKQKEENQKQEEKERAAKVVNALRRQKEALLARQQNQMLKQKEDEEAKKRKEGASRQQQVVEQERLRLAEEERLRLAEEERHRMVEEERRRMIEEEQHRIAEQQRFELEQREAEAAIREQLLSKQQELLKLQQQRMELELKQQLIKVEEQKQALLHAQEELKRKEEEKLRAGDKDKKEVSGPAVVSASTSASSTSVPCEATSEDPTAKRDPRLVKIAQRDPRSREASPIAPPQVEKSKKDIVHREKDKQKLLTKGKAPKSPEKKNLAKRTASQTVFTKEGKKTTLPVKEEKKSISREKELPKSYRDRSPDKRGRGGRGYSSRHDPRPRKQRSRTPEMKEGSSRSNTVNKKRGSKSSSPTRPRSRTRSRSPHNERSPRQDRTSRGGEWKKRNYRRTSNTDGDEQVEKEMQDIKTKDSLEMERPRPKSRTRRRSSEEEHHEMPPVKKTRPEEKETEAKKDTLSSDLIGLFGSEDQDYRRLPRIPKLAPGSESQPAANSLQSPRQEGWAQFKASRPGEFPFSQPRRASIDVQGSPEFPMPNPVLMSPTENLTDAERKDLVLTKPHMLNNAEEVLNQADLQFKRGKISFEQYQELLTQMDKLYQIQKLRMEERLKAQGEAISGSSTDKEVPPPRPLPVPERLRSPPNEDRYSPGAAGGPSHRGPFPRDEVPFAGKAPSTSGIAIREPFFGERAPCSPNRDAYGPPRTGSPAPLGGPHDSLALRPVPRPPAPPELLTSQDRSERRPTPPFQPVVEPSGPMGRLYMEGPNPDSANMNSVPQDLPSEDFYVPQYDLRWAGKKHRGKESSMRTHIVIIDGRSFDMKPNCVQRIRLGTRTFEIGIDLKTREVTIGGECYLKLGQPERQVVLSGRKYSLFARGQSKNVWVDNYQYELFMDAPAEKVLIGGKEHMIELNSSSNMLIVDGFDVCPIINTPQQVNIAFEPHDIAFSPPPRNILIDNKTCQLNFSGEFPVVFIDGKPHGIRFDGHAREIWVNNVAYRVDMHKPRRCKLPREHMRPFLLAFGGPGHEVIIEDQWYEVKFGGEEKVIALRDKKITVRLELPPPEVKILGEVVSPEQMQAIINEDAMRRNQPRVPSLLDLDVKPSSLGLGPRGPGGPPGPMIGGPDNHRGPMGPDRLGRPGMSEGPMGHGGPMGPDDWVGPRGPMAHLNRGPMGFEPGPDSYMPEEPNPGFGGQMDMDMGPRMMGGPVDPGNGLGDNQGQQGVGNLAPAPNKVDVNDLLSKLISAGIINKSEEKKEETKPPMKKETFASKREKDKKGKDEDESDEETIRDIEEIPDLTDIDNTEQLKKTYRGVIQQLYSGVQCPSCGIRFTTEDSDRYREHLDWHFRQNQREKDQIKVAKFRRWYYDESDWVQFEEIGDLEERAYSQFFETMMSTNQSSTGGQTHNPEVISCPVAKGENDDVCDICGEAFEQFYDDEEEEWHLKDAVRANDRTYHPVCYDDAKETGSVVDPETPTPTPETPMPDPIANPLAYLEHLSRKNKLLQASSNQSEPAPASSAPAILSQVVTSTLSVPSSSSVVSVPAVKLEPPEESVAEPVAEKPESNNESSSLMLAAVKQEPHSDTEEDIKPTAESLPDVTGSDDTSKPGRTGSELSTQSETSSLLTVTEVKQEPMETDPVCDTPAEVAATNVAEPVATSSVHIGEEPVLAGSVQIKAESMQSEDGSEVEEPTEAATSDQTRKESDDETQIKMESDSVPQIKEELDGETTVSESSENVATNDASQDKDAKDTKSSTDTTLS